MKKLESIKNSKQKLPVLGAKITVGKWKTSVFSNTNKIFKTFLDTATDSGYCASKLKVS